MPLPDSALTENSSAASFGVRQPANIRRATDLPRVKRGHATIRLTEAGVTAATPQNISILRLALFVIDSDFNCVTRREVR